MKISILYPTPAFLQRKDIGKVSRRGRPTFMMIMRVVGRAHVFDSIAAAAFAAAADGAVAGDLVRLGSFLGIFVCVMVLQEKGVEEYVR